METNRLLGDEIVYELLIRGLPVQKTVQENRITLRGALRCERDGVPSFIDTTHLEPNLELDVCNNKLLDLKKDVQEFDMSNKINEIKRIKSRLIHIKNRLHKIPHMTQDREKFRHNLVGLCLSLIDTVGVIEESSNLPPSYNVSENIVDQENYVRSIIDDPNPLIPSRDTSTYVLNINKDFEEMKISSPLKDETDDLIDFGDRPTHPTFLKVLAQSTSRSGDRIRSEQTHSLLYSTTVAETNVTPTVSTIKEKDFKVTHKNSETDEEGNRSEVRFVDRSEDYYHEPTWNSTRIPYSDLTRQNQTYNVKPNLNCQQIPRINTVRELDIGVQDLHRSPITTHRTQECYHVPYFDVSRWKLHFDGESSVTSFLERLEELRLSRNVSHDQLLRSAAELFTKDALIWYRTQTFQTWEELVKKLKEDFQPYNYEYDLWEEIRRRSQGAKERVVVYISSMENLFNKLGVKKPSEDVRIDMIRRNLLPYIQGQLALQTITTISELLRLSRAVEETSQRMARFSPPPTNYRQLLEPELAYRNPNSGNRNLAPAVGTTFSESRADQNVALVSTPQTSTASMTICWNCNQSGHRFKKCEKPRQVFCFKCGNANFTSKNCPKCQKNGKGGQ